MFLLCLDMKAKGSGCILRARGEGEPRKRRGGQG